MGGKKYYGKGIRDKPYCNEGRVLGKEERAEPVTVNKTRGS